MTRELLIRTGVVLARVCQRLRLSETQRRAAVEIIHQVKKATGWPTLKWDDLAGHVMGLNVDRDRLHELLTKISRSLVVVSEYDKLPDIAANLRKELDEIRAWKDAHREDEVRLMNCRRHRDRLGEWKDAHMSDALKLKTAEAQLVKATADLDYMRARLLAYGDKA